MACRFFITLNEQFIMKKIAISALLAFTISMIQAQNANDVLRYSQASCNGTARFMGLSGAYGAIGADFSSLSQNPAGIGLYRQSEFTVTPGFNISSTKSEFYGTHQSDFRNNLFLGNLGMVFALNLNDTRKEGPLKGLQLGFGMNRINNFNNRILVEGFNTSTSLMAHYANLANNYGSPLSVGELNEFSTLLAYDVNLLVFDSSSSSNPYWVDMPNGSVLQRKSSLMTGSSREMLLTGGMNFENKLYLGLSLSFPSIRFSEESTFSEHDNKNLSSDADPEFNFASLRRSENLTTRGNGFNLKFGFIFKPIEFIRLGGAFHTSTSYNLTDEWSSQMISYFENGNNYNSSSPDGAFDYRITTPLKAMGSIAFVFPRYGFISADYEYVDYSAARLRSDDYDFFDENAVVQTSLGAANNIRLGAEFRQGILAFRIGSSFYGSPYAGESTRGARMGYSTGIGLREKDYFLDFAFNHQQLEDDLYLYGNTASRNKYYNNQFQMTLGLRF
jgi:hypothetical protein